MFEGAAAGGEPVTARLAMLADELRGLPLAASTAALVDQVRLLEELKSVAAAAQAVATAAFVRARREEREQAGTPADLVGRGIAHEVALAKRESPHRARRYVGWAQVLVGELPATLTALRSGQTSEWRAMIVARETAWLSREHRAEVDQLMGRRLPGLGDRGVEAETKRHAYRLDPYGYVDRIRAAEADRRVTLRPAPDTMTRSTALLPVAQGVAALAALRAHADTARATGDPRSRGQVMADTLIERLTGQVTAEQVPLTVNLIMTDQSLLRVGDDPDSPAVVDGFGAIPAPAARELISRDEAPVTVRRLFADPQTGQLIRMESRSRLFTDAQRTFIRLRDQSCRTPYCDAAVRQIDHVKAAAAGGLTTVDNGQGLCEACNYAKEAPGWNSTVQPDGEIEITTPTGQRHRSRAPDPPGSPVPVMAAHVVA